MFNITNNAVEKIKQILIESGIPENYGVRITVEGHRDSGLNYDFKFEQKPGISDEVINKGGLKFFLDGKALFYLRNVLIDYQKNENNEGFVFNEEKSL